MILLLILIISITPLHAQRFGLSDEIKWRYISKSVAPEPRSGQYWRAGVMLKDKIIVLNTYHLIALDYNKKELWIYEFPSEYLFSKAKIHVLNENEILVINSHSVLKIDSATGKLINNYGITPNNPLLEFTPNLSHVYENKVYLSLGKDLLSIDIETLKPEVVHELPSSLKTKIIDYKNHLVLGSSTGDVYFVNPETKTLNTLVTTNSIRQPIVINDTLYIPTKDYIFSYHDAELLTQTDKFRDAIISEINNKLFLRKHKQGILVQLDPITLMDLASISYENKRHAGQINEHLFGTEKYVVHIDSIKGHMIIFSYDDDSIKVVKEYFTEDFLDNPPLQYLDQKNDLMLLGAFDGLYLLEYPTE